MNTIANKNNTIKTNKTNKTKSKGKNVKVILTKEKSNVKCTCDTHYGIYYRTATPAKFNKTNFKALSDNTMKMIDVVPSRPNTIMTFAIPTSFS